MTAASEPMPTIGRATDSWTESHRARLWPLLVLVFVVAFLASLLTLVLSAAVSTNASRPGSHGARLGIAAVRASAPPTLEAVPASVLTTRDPDASQALPAARAHQQPRASAPEDDRQSRLPVTEEVAGSTPAGGAVSDLIRSAAIEFGADPETMLRRAFCESTNNPDAVGRAQEVSIFQFLPSTWVIYAPKVGYSLREIGHVEAQARVAAYMESIGEGRQWTCR